MDDGGPAASSRLLRASLQVPGVMSHSQRLLQSRRRPQAKGRNRTNLLHAKAFALHPGLRSAETPPGGQKGAYRNILRGVQPECSDFQKSAITFWFSFCFPEGKGVRCLFIYFCPDVGVHIWIKPALALWVNI